MRIITWNCNMAFRKKSDEILKYKPDILIVQECENLEKLEMDKFSVRPSDSFWVGENPNKGMAIFSFGTTRLEELDYPEEDDKWIVPYKVNGKCGFRLFAVWAMNHRKNAVINRTGPTYLTFKKYGDYLKEDVIIVGDFNDNTIWDQKYFRKGNFSDIVDLFNEYDIGSCYHDFTKGNFGEEKRNTIYWRKNKHTPYHIDYCFAKRKYIRALKDFTVGENENWMKFSDHFPIIMDLDVDLLE